MKTVIIILFVVLIGFGVLLSSNHYVQQDLEQAKFEKTQSENENQQLREQLATQSQVVNQMSRQLEQLKLEKQAMENELQARVADNTKLSEALADAEGRLARSGEEINVLRQQVGGLQSTNEHLLADNATLKERAYLTGNPSDSLFIPMTGSSATDRMMPILLIVGLPISILLTLMLNRRIRRHVFQFLRNYLQDSAGTILLLVTEEEKDQLIRMRRKR